MHVLGRLGRIVRALGVRSALRYLWVVRVSERLPARMKPSGPLVRLSVPGRRAPLYARRGSSDLAAFWQIFIRREYEHCVRSEGVDVIVDCGANVGYTSVFLAHAHPDAVVYAIEPEPSNYELLTRNTRPEGERIVALRAAVWPGSEAMRIVQPEDAAEHWAASVEPLDSGESVDGQDEVVPGIGLPELMDRWGLEAIQILKIDIEGAEEELLSVEPEAWIGRVDSIVAECHSQRAVALFEKVASDAGMRVVDLRHGSWLAFRERRGSLPSEEDVTD